MSHDNGIAFVPAGDSGGSSPFDSIRRVDGYGREYWLGREMQPLMEYSQWAKFEAVIEKAKASLALVQGEVAAQNHFSQTGSMVRIGSGAERKVRDYSLTRFGAYLVAMAGDDTKEAVAQARVYFAVRTHEAELTALTEIEVRQTALARAREMVDYKTFRDMMADNAPDYEPSSKESGLFFATAQNTMYLGLFGMGAPQLKTARQLNTWPGREEGKPEPGPKSAVRKVAKNYLTAAELKKLNLTIGRLCLLAESIADDGLNLSLDGWMAIINQELAFDVRRVITS